MSCRQVEPFPQRIFGACWKTANVGLWLAAVRTGACVWEHKHAARRQSVPILVSLGLPHLPTGRRDRNCQPGNRRFWNAEKRVAAFQNNDKRHRVCSNLFLHLEPSIVRSVLNLQPGQQSKKRAPAAAHLIETIRWGLLQLSRATGSKAWRGAPLARALFTPASQ